MAEQQKNAQVLNGINDDITELKSLNTLRKRVVSDGEIVSNSANGFRLSNGSTGVFLRNDGRDFYGSRSVSGRAVEHPAAVFIQSLQRSRLTAKRRGYLRRRCRFA